jgi:hypothetical protein
MENLTWVGIVAVLLFLSQLLNIYNSSKTAKRNADEPLREVKEISIENKNEIVALKYRLEKDEEDINHAHEKIRENQKITKSQNKALLAILLALQNPERTDMQKILDDAIKAISE